MLCAMRAFRATVSRAWHAVAAEQAADDLGVDVRRGLASAEASARLAQFGPNVITVRRGQAWWQRALLQFHAPLVYILIVAGVVTLALGEGVDSTVIFAVVLVNAVIGYVEETRAVKAIGALARSLRVEATVLRDGQRRRIEAAQLVIGDIVFLEPGDRVGADLRLVRVHDLHADESMLTGESAPVAKRIEPLDEETVLADRRNLAYAGSLITRGTGEGIVVATADATEVGRISALISSAEDLATPLTRKIASFSRLLLWIILSIAGLTFAVGLWRGYGAVEVFKASVALAVGAIPEGLPAAVTIMLAVGVSRMARRRAIIRRLPAVEALGSTTVICTDKTGTLTQNQMTVHAAWVLRAGGAGASAGVEYEFTGAGYDPAGEVRVRGSASPAPTEEHPVLMEMLRCGCLCNDAALIAEEGGGERWEIRGDPTEAALIVASRKAGLAQESLAESWPRLDAIPFESDRQYMATLHQPIPTPANDGGSGHREAEPGAVIYVKGSVERVLSMCRQALDSQGRITGLEREAVAAAAADLAARGLRILAFARCEAPPGIEEITRPMVEQGVGLAGGGLVFLGVLGMLDPPRPEAAEAIAACRRAGILVKMITGDHALTAAAIARMIGLADPSESADAPGERDRCSGVLTGADLAAISDEDLPAHAIDTAVFARMTPEQKIRLVRALQSRGHIVAMTGDGVNDAPALRQADIGVAMGRSGTEAARDAADMVLADDNFASIRAAVEEGRTVFTNLTKFIIWTLPTNGGEALVILSSILFGWALPILPVHALYVNMATAILLGMPLIFEASEPDVMDRPPRDPSRPLLTFEIFMRSGLVSLLLCAGAMGVFYWELGRGLTEAAARTAAVSVIVVGETFYLFSSRALLGPAWAVPLLSNLWLWAGIGAMLAVQFAFAHWPIVNRVFHSAPLDGSAWCRVFIAGAAVLLVVEIEKALRRYLARGDGRRPA